MSQTKPAALLSWTTVERFDAKLAEAVKREAHRGSERNEHEVILAALQQLELVGSTERARQALLNRARTPSGGEQPTGPGQSPLALQLARATTPVKAERHTKKGPATFDFTREPTNVSIHTITTDRLPCAVFNQTAFSRGDNPKTFQLTSFGGDAPSIAATRTIRLANYMTEIVPRSDGSFIIWGNPGELDPAIFDAEGKIVCELETPATTWCAVHVRPDDSFFAFGKGWGALYSATGTRLQQMKMSPEYPYLGWQLPNQDLLVGRHDQLNVWSPQGEKRATWDLPRSPSARPPHSIQTTTQGNLVVTWRDDYTRKHVVGLYDLGFNELRRIVLPEFGCMVAAPDGQFLYVQHDDSAPALVFSSQLEPVGETTVPLNRATFFADGRLLSADSDGRPWDTKDVSCKVFTFADSGGVPQSSEG